MITDNIKLYHGRCEEKFAEIPDNSIDLILTDPPYGTTACKWDTVIDFDIMWREIKRVRKDKTAVVLFGSEPFSSYLRMSNIKEFKYDWYWRKPKGTGHLNAKKQPMRDTEIISVFHKHNYYPVKANGTPYKDKAGKNYNGNSSMTDLYGKYTNIRYNNDGFRYPKQGIDFSVVERNTLHPTQKPLDLIKYLINTYTKEGDTVLDFTMGSGTTGVGCVELDRKFIGIETDYFDVAKERIEKALINKNSLFGIK